ncbi:MAG: bifunctional sulfate adenylyltransferase/adenylylsulfate kinase [Pyrinomonadaceae bacterium]
MVEPETVLIRPCGGELVNLLVPAGAVAELRAYAARLPALHLSERATCDLELLATGAFAPLDRFMGRRDHQRVLDEMRLADGHIFPIPLTLPVAADSGVRAGQDVALRSPQNELLAVLSVEEVYEWDHAEVARKVFGTEDLRHPLVAEMHRWGRLNVSGPLRVLQLPRHYDFPELRRTPAEVRARLATLGRENIVAFQTRNALHRAHEELIKRALAETDGALLFHPVVGLSKPGDVDHYSRVRTYKAVVERYFDPRQVLLALLPLAMRLAGPREALWHALIRRNYGANHLIVGRDHASPGLDSTGQPFYGPYDAQELVARYSAELGVKALPFQELLYLPAADEYVEAARVPHGARALSLSGTEVRAEYLHQGRRLPAWFTRPEVARLLAETHPPRHQQGVCIWFTGLSCAGKSTTAEILTVMLLAHGRRVTLLDGDVVRTHLSAGLGFSKADRDVNIRRIGFVASEIVRHGGVAVCAAISPYRATRNDVRNMCGGAHFVEVFVATPLAVCEQRDAKGLYARARRGDIREFTGIDDPYEPPRHAEITLDTITHTPDENARRIVTYLIERGFVRDQSDTETNERAAEY